MKSLLEVAGILLFALVCALLVLPSRLLGKTTPRPDATATPPIDERVMLDAIAQVESGNRPGRVGLAGERGRCQIKEITWRRYSRKPFLLWAPVDCAVTREVELKHLRTICRELTREMLSLEPCFIAAAWHHGEHAAANHARDDDAQRAANLYFDTLTQRAKGRS